MGDRQRKAEHQTGDAYSIEALGGFGYLLLAVRKDTPAALAEDGEYIPVSVDDAGRLHVALGDAASSVNQSTIIGELEAINSLVQDAHDYIGLTYTGDNLTTVVFKTGGSGGTTVSTLTLAYTGARLDSVTQA